MTASRALRRPTRDERAKERAFVGTNIADTAITATLVVVAITSGSLTMLSEAVRTVALLVVDYFTIWVLFAVHRGRLSHYEYGVGKLEQFVWVVCGAGLIFGGLWVGKTVVATMLSSAPAASPLGLTLAAVVNGVNVTINALGLYGMYSASRGDDTGVFGAQIRARQAALGVTIVLQITLTAAALAKDPGIALILDALGAVLVVVIKLRRGVMMIARALPHLLDAPASDELAERISRIVAEFIPTEHLVTIRTRRSGATTFAEVVFSDGAFPTIAALDASTQKIREAIGREGARVDLSLVVVPEAEKENYPATTDHDRG